AGRNRGLAGVLVKTRVSLAPPVTPGLVQNEGISVKKMSPNTMMIVNLISPDKWLALDAKGKAIEGAQVKKIRGKQGAVEAGEKPLANAKVTKVPGRYDATFLSNYATIYIK